MTIYICNSNQLCVCTRALFSLLLSFFALEYILILSVFTLEIESRNGKNVGNMNKSWDRASFVVTFCFYSLRETTSLTTTMKMSFIEWKPNQCDLFCIILIFVKYTRIE